MADRKKKEKDISITLDSEKKTFSEIALIKDFQDINKMNHTNYVILLLSVFAILNAVIIEWINLEKVNNNFNIIWIILIGFIGFLFFSWMLWKKYIKPNREDFEYKHKMIRERYQRLGINIEKLDEELKKNVK